MTADQARQLSKDSVPRLIADTLANALADISRNCGLGGLRCSTATFAPDEVRAAIAVELRALGYHVVVREHEVMISWDSLACELAALEARSS